MVAKKALQTFEIETKDITLIKLCLCFVHNNFDKNGLSHDAQIVLYGRSVANCIQQSHGTYILINVHFIDNVSQGFA